MLKSRQTVLTVAVNLIIIFSFFMMANADIIEIPTHYSTIQGGISAAKDYDTVLVLPGIYTEALNYEGKLIIVKSSEGPLVTTITNSPSVNLALFTNGETNDAILEGFTLLGGKSAVLCENAGPTIKGNILKNQNITDWGAISLGGNGYATVGNSPALIINNTIVGCANGGISTFSSAAPTYINNIIAFNFHYAFHRASSDLPHPIMSYNCTFGNDIDFQNISALGDGHLFDNPLFSGDYSLQFGSPCIDAGHPDPIYNDPDGSRNDMGAVPFEGEGPTEPMVLYVPSEYPTIQSAIDAAFNGDTVLVAAGSYAENVEFYGKGIMLLTEDGAENTTITAPASSVAYRLPVDYDSTATPADTTDMRMKAEQSADTEILDISGTSRSTVINGFTIDGKNSVRGIYGMQSSAEISDCIIQNCLGPYDAGAIFFERGAPLIKNNIIRNNTTPISGGAIFIRLGYGYGRAEIVDNVIHNNTSGNGPAVSLIEGDDAIVLRNTCYYNVGTPGSTRKGAIYFHADNIDVINNSLIHNTLGITVLITDDCDVRNNIVAFSDEYGLEVLYNEGPNPGFTYDYNDVYANTGGDYWQVDPAAHDISDEPMFNPDYSLMDGSPCIDAGDPNPIYNDPDGSRNDMGAIPSSQISGGDATIMLSPSPILAVYRYVVEERSAFIYLGGDFEEGYDINDIELSSLIINNQFVPAGFEITTHPEFSGDVLKLSIDLSSFVASYGILWDETIQDYWISGSFTDEATFVEASTFTFKGHISGDVNNDGNINLLDVTATVAWIYMDGANPIPIDEIADVDGSGLYNILDVTYLVAFLYNNGPAPEHQ